MFIATKRIARSSRAMGQYVITDRAAYSAALGLPPAPKPRPRFLGAYRSSCLSGLGCASCKGKCSTRAKTMGDIDWSDVTDSITSILKSTLPVIINDTVGPGAQQSALLTQQQQILAAQAAAQAQAQAQANAAAAAAAIAAATPAPAGSVKIFGYNVPYWALGVGGVGAALMIAK